MKVKNIYAVLGIILASGNLAFAETKDALFNDILQAHAAVFGVNNIFDQELDNMYLWKDAFNKVQNFVDKNAGGNKKLWNAFIACRKVNETLIFVIREAFAIVFSSEVKQKKSSDQLLSSYRAAGRNIRKLDESKRDLQEQVTILKNTRYYIDAQRKNSVKDILLELIPILAAGFCKLSLFPFIVCSFIARGARFYLLAGIIRVLGVHIQQSINRYFNIMIGLTALAVIFSFWIFSS